MTLPGQRICDSRHDARKLVAVVAVVAALALAACSSSKVVALVEGRAAEICRCADLRCVADTVVKFQKELDAHKDPKGSEADQKRIDSAVAREAACIERLRVASSTGNAPAASDAGVPAP